MAAWEVVDSRLVLDGSPWIRVWEERIRLPSGREITPFFRYEKSDFATIFATDAAGDVIVERRYRHGPRTVTLDLPAGYLEPGEEPLAAAQRELREETGYEASAWHAFGSVHTDGNSGGSRCHFFLATGAKRVSDPAEDDTEESEILLMPPDALRAALDSGAFATMVATACAARGLLHLAGRAP